MEKQGHTTSTSNISTKYIIKFDTKTTWSLISSMEFLTPNKAEKMLTNFTKGYIKDV